MSATEVEDIEEPMIQLVSLYANHGSIIQFEGHAEDDPEKRCIVSCDHRPAMDIAEALEADETVLVDPEPWAVRWLS